ncbi:YybH family protein [Massilia niastensis]|uniref:YybH family protein n=1 Tax=Massilia niastensis TaxID=544911 RepID=UPI0003AA5C5A|nr:SgcJ/EcaC family oxidoreductase [Massilia niastensis]
MRPIHLAPLLAAALAALLPAFPALAQTLPSISVPPGIDRVLRDYEKAWAANDATALASLFTEDGMALPSGQQPARGKDSIARAYAGGGAMPTYLRVLDYRASGDMAYVVGGYGPAGQPDDVGKFVLVLRQVDGRWLIAADIENANRRMGPPPRPAAKPAG